MYASAFDTAAEAVDDLERLFGSSFEVLNIGWATIRSTLAICRLVLGFR